MTELWLGPDVDSDLLSLVDQPDAWTVARRRCNALQLYAQQCWNETDGEDGIGLNTWPRLRDAKFFSRVAALGLPFTIEGPGMKGWGCDGVAAAEQVATVIRRIREEGNQVIAVSLDEPLQACADCHCTLEQAVEPTAKVIRAGRDAGCAGMGVAVAWPASSPTDIIRYFKLLQQIGCSPSHMTVDVDTNGLVHFSSARQRAEFSHLRTQCAAWGIPFRVIIHGQRGDTPSTYRAGAWNWFQQSQQLLGGHPDGYIVQSWKHKNLPVNVPESDSLSHTALLRDIAVAIQPEGTADMNWTKVRVVGKTLTLVEGPDAGKVLNFGPKGWEPPTPAGTSGTYETCTMSGGFAKYELSGGPVGVFPLQALDSGIWIIADKDPQ